MKKLLFLITLSLNSLITNAQSPVIQWQKSTGGTGFDFGKSIQQTMDGGYIVAGYSESNDGDIIGNHGGGDCWIVKHNNLGLVQWQKSLGGTGFDYGYSIQQTTDSGYIVVGYSESNDGDVVGNHGGGDCWIIKLDSVGSIMWQKSLGGSGADNGESIKQTSDGGYVVASYSESNDGDVTGSYGDGDCWVTKLDDFGNIQWQKSLGGSLYDFGQFIEQTSDGGYILTGGSESNDGDVTGNHGHGDCWVVKLDDLGNIQWQKSLGGSLYDFGQSIQQNTDGGYIVTGYSESNNGNITGNHGNGDCWVIKLDNTGVIQWQKPLGGSGNDYGFAGQQTADGGYVIGGYSESTNGNVIGNHGNCDSWIIKLNATGIIQWRKSLGGTGFDYGYFIQQTTDAGYIVAGYSESNDGDVTGNHGGGDCWIVKLDSTTVAVPSIIAASANNVCEFMGSSNNVTYTIAAVNYATSYLWTVPVGAILISGQGTTSITVKYKNTFTSGYISVKSIAGVDQSAARLLTITKALPAMPSSITPSVANVCMFIGSADSVNYSIAQVPNAVSYLWTVPLGATILSGQGTTSIYVHYANTFTSGYVTVKSVSGCGSSAVRKLLIIKKIPLTPNAISGPVNACIYIGDTTCATYSISTVTGASSYLWTVPAGTTLVSGQGTNSIHVRFSTSFISGKIEVSSSSPCGNSGVRILAICLKIPTVPVAITGPRSVCTYLGTNNNIANYSVTSDPNATSYNWTVPAGATITSGQGTANIEVLFAGTFNLGNITVRAISGCGSSNVKTLAISAKPALPGNISGPSNLYGMSTANYSIAEVAGAISYTWTLPIGVTILAGSNTNTIEVKIDSTYIPGKISVVALNDCGTSAIRSLTLKSTRNFIVTDPMDESTLSLSNLYPNPSSDFFTIELNTKIDKMVVLEIFNALGDRLIYEKYSLVIGENSIKTNIEKFQNGIYLVRLIDLSTNSVSTKHLVKQ